MTCSFVGHARRQQSRYLTPHQAQNRRSLGTPFLGATRARKNARARFTRSRNDEFPFVFLFLRSLLILFLLAGPPAAAQTTAMLMPVPRQPFLDGNGNPLSLGKVYFCVAGTTCPGNPQATYTDSTGGVANSNPVLLDAAGLPTASGSASGIWLGASAYKVCAYNAGGVQQWCIDNVTTANLKTVSNLTSGNCSNPVPASAGFLRMCNGDLINWRNIANGADIGFSQAGAAAAGSGNIADVVRYGDATHGGIQAQAFMDFSLDPAQSGVFRCGNNVNCVVARNAAGGADVTISLVDASNVTNLGGSAGVKFPGPINFNSQTFSGVPGFAMAGALNITANTGIPAATNTNLWIGSGFSSPSIGKLYIGDGTGWELDFAKRTGSTDTTLFKFSDAGKLFVGGGITNSGPGFMHVRQAICTSVTSGTFDGCNTTLTWPGTWADTSYTAACTVDGANIPVIVVGTGTKTTTTTLVAVAKFNDGGSHTTISGTLNCIGLHD